MKRDRVDNLQRRQLLAAAATLGLAHWLPSASAAPAEASRAGTNGATPAAASATRRRLGPLEVFPIGLGCQWTPGRVPGAVNDLYASTADRTAAIALIRRAVDLGVTLIDTAEAYGPFFSEDRRRVAAGHPRHGRPVHQVRLRRLPRSILIAFCSGFSVMATLGSRVRSFLIILSRSFIAFSFQDLGLGRSLLDE